MKPVRGDSDGSRLEMRSSWGTVKVHARGGKVRACCLPALSAEPRRPFKWFRAEVLSGDPADARVLKQAEKFVRSVFSGRPAEAPPFEWPRATPFTARVWRALAAIPSGQTLEYGVLARRIGRPGGSRAVGRACGANPLPLFVPCHRVLPKDGTLGGFTGGLPWKRLLLERERKA